MPAAWPGVDGKTSYEHRRYRRKTGKISGFQFPATAARNANLECKSETKHPNIISPGFKE